MLLRIMENPQIGEMALLSHRKQIINGSLFNVLVLALLARAEGGQYKPQTHPQLAMDILQKISIIFLFSFW